MRSRSDLEAIKQAAPRPWRPPSAPSPRNEERARGAVRSFA
ncbi:conserved hypothetical protein [Burkholderia mallei PRL-20]|nr:hypothetical protein BMASAVP1_A2164 [Burkholderia mallei SAVP1]ABO04825.1 hypothetical protein BMA10247_1437 [Burkholderia mallei NCTC 10247]EEP87619.1 conserved hypothetical protein [Burkholderia mallei GB8 horse 4]EES44663.1 conserved hypothetical protein [Burkholderia mallei PRL-20]